MKLKDIINLKSEKLALALLLIGISTMAVVVVYLFKNSQSSCDEYRQEFKNCQKELLKIQSDYRNDIQHIYLDVISELKESKKVIKSQIRLINNKKRDIINKQNYLNSVLDKFEGYEKLNNNK